MTDFFEPGFEYTDATPYTAPEIIRTFRCVAVATLPGTNMPLAFGFMHTDSLGWGGTGMDQNHWRKGWDRCDGASGVIDATAAVPTEVWYYTDDDGGSSVEAYLDAETAKDAAVELYASEYDLADADAEFTWRKSTPRDTDRSPWWLLDYDGVFTGWSVDSVRIAASVAKAGA